jgi:hypothetical protein
VLKQINNTTHDNPFQPSIQWVLLVIFSGFKQLGREADQPMNVYSYTSISTHDFCVVVLKYRHNFYFTFYATGK